MLANLLVKLNLKLVVLSDRLSVGDTHWAKLPDYAVLKLDTISKDFQVQLALPTDQDLTVVFVDLDLNGRVLPRQVVQDLLKLLLVTATFCLNRAEKDRRRHGYAAENYLFAVRFV